MKKHLSIFTALALVLQPVFAFAAPVTITPIASQSIPASGTLQASTAFSAVIRNLADDSSATALNCNAASAVLTPLPQYLEVNFNDNHTGRVGIVISTDNRVPSANPRFSPGFTSATGGGLVGKSVKATDQTGHGAVNNDLITAAPLLWTVFDDVVGAKAYSFTGDTTKEAFVVDRQQNIASEIDTDPVTPGVQPPAAFADDGTIGYAAIVNLISGQNGNLSFAGANGGPLRLTTDGKVFVRLAANYSGQTAQDYATSTLTLELITY